MENLMRVQAACRPIDPADLRIALKVKRRQTGDTEGAGVVGNGPCLCSLSVRMLRTPTKMLRDDQKANQIVCVMPHRNAVPQFLTKWI
jgi:hypothetical protein